ncbi:MAG: hypothetical protein JW891_12445 [Candidatus Lokiarchaeota archaeon]|nr:hypothetical protein [Candidatus Lokiarchaeota archaeon]
MALEIYDYISGSFSLLLIGLAIFSSLNVLLKFHKTKRLEFLYFGISIIVLVEPWLPGVISFIFALFNNGNGILLPIYLFLGSFLYPLGIGAWVQVFTSLVYIKKKKYVLILAIILGALFEIYFLYLLFTDYTLIGILKGEIDVEYRLTMLVIQFLVLIYVLITGIKIAIETLKFEGREFKIKGRLMIIGFALLAIGATLDATISYTHEMLVITRSLVMMSMILLYCGFFMPNWMKKLLKIL